jgi:DNA-binding MarR family transcriptional regulator
MSDGARDNGTAWVDRTASLGYQVNALARLLATLLHREIAPHGVAPGQFAQLLALYDRDGRTPSELSRAVSIEPGTMTKTLQRMERDGLVERRRDPRDGRAVTIHLTEHATRLEPDLKKAAARVNQLVTRHLQEREIRSFMNTLASLVDDASKQVADEARSGPV